MCRLDYTEERLWGARGGGRPRLVWQLRWVAKEVRRKMTTGAREEQTIAH